MKLLGGGGDSGPKESEIRYPPTGALIPQSWRVVERYALNAPFAYAAIVEDSETMTRRYYLDEVALEPKEAAVYTHLLDALESELTVPRSEVDPKAYFREQARNIVKKYRMKASQIAWPKILYFAERDLVGFGMIDGLMHDPNIEDISADGVKRPVFVYQRRYENLETNLTFRTDEDLDNLIARMAHTAGRHVSTAYPIVQGTLPGRHRLSATFRREVSPNGGTFTIRKFMEDPITIIDMLSMNVVDHSMAAYLWLLMENRATALVAGATGSGKTTLLNALLTLPRLNTKLVTIEEVQEINVAHVNWAALVSRQSYGAGVETGKEVGLFDLVKTAMRMRPDILVVGEVRGEEAYVLFQAVSTGHGGLCTIHADDAASAIQRLTSKPMDVPPAFIPFLDLVLTVRRVAIAAPGGGFRTIRRVMSVDEVVSVGNYIQMFRWDSSTDKHMQTNLKNSVKLARLSKDIGMSIPELTDEINNRSMVLKWAQQRGVRNFRDLSTLMEEYRNARSELLERVERDLGPMAATVSGGREGVTF